MNSTPIENHQEELWGMLQSRIESRFIIYARDRIRQGDILRDVRFGSVEESDKVIEYDFQYLIVISQDCDLEQYQKKMNEKSDGEILNQFLPFVLLIPAYSAEQAREGTHLKDLFQIVHNRINSDQWKIVTDNRDERYHYLHGFPDCQVPNLLCDFKHHFTVPFKVLLSKYNEGYLASVSELFRENLSRRFANYLSRIGLPVLP